MMAMPNKHVRSEAAGNGKILDRRSRCRCSSVYSAANRRRNESAVRAVADNVEADPRTRQQVEECFVPRTIADVNVKNLLGYASDLGEDHPGFHDKEYKRRRMEIVQMALDHRL